ncbi:hypothetical protein [Brevibacillus agri]|uniref:hypothetical protein n=1 Tax=Brevibacillus agri TaxID=51101 RepID=UPI0025B6FF77|nr:hypothetical protein [Brevibacillus agri]MDN4093922.1 hypothetical protein [Brevibacillus agri]
MSMLEASVAMPGSIVGGSPVMLQCKTIGSCAADFSVPSAACWFAAGWAFSAGVVVQPMSKLASNDVLQTTRNHVFISDPIFIQKI